MRTLVATLLLLVPCLAGAADAIPTVSIRTVSAAGVSVESAALLMSGQQGGEIPLTALALPVRGDEDKARVLVRLRMDGPALLSGQAGAVLRIEASLYALGTGGGVQGSLLETIEIDLPSLRGAVERSGVDLLGSLDLKPGAYTLRILTRNLDTGKLSVRSLPLPVPPAESLDAAPSLAPPPEGDLRPTARSASLGPFDPPSFPDDPMAGAGAPILPAVPTAPAIPDTAEGRRLRIAVRAAYRAALALLSAAREAEALAAVEALEDSLFARAETPLTVEAVIEIEAEAGRELGPESLVPVLRLHQRLYEEATVKRRLQGSTVAREVFLKLLDVYRSQGQKEWALRFSSTFGVELIRSGIGIQGGRTLQGVLAEAPGNEMVLLELAAMAERRRDRAEALRLLALLSQAHPDNGEIRVRTAIDLSRMGSPEAEGKLRELIQKETGGWALTLAYQELVRLMMSQGRPVEETLREGLKRLPGDEKLTLLLAAVLEKTARRGAAGETLARLTPEQDGGGAARHRYNRPPDEPFATVLRELDREAAARRPALAAALERTAS